MFQETRRNLSEIYFPEIRKILTKYQNTKYLYIQILRIERINIQVYGILQHPHFIKRTNWLELHLQRHRNSRNLASKIKNAATVQQFERDTFERLIPHVFSKTYFRAISIIVLSRGATTLNLLEFNSFILVRSPEVA